MRLYTVIITRYNGELSKLGMIGENDTIVQKVKKLLQDIDGGVAEVYGDDFYSMVEV